MNEHSQTKQKKKGINQETKKIASNQRNPFLIFFKTISGNLHSDKKPNFDPHSKPYEIWAHIFDDLLPKDIANLRRVSKGMLGIVDFSKSGIFYRKAFENFYQKDHHSLGYQLFLTPFWKWFTANTPPVVRDNYIKAVLSLYKENFKYQIDEHNRCMRDPARPRDPDAAGGYLYEFSSLRDAAISMGFDPSTPLPIIEACFEQIGDVENAGNRESLINLLIYRHERPPEGWLNLAEKLLLNGTIEDPIRRLSFLRSIFIRADQSLRDRMREHGFSVQDICGCKIHPPSRMDAFRFSVLESINRERFPKEEDRLFLLKHLASFPKLQLKIANNYFNQLSLEANHQELTQTLLDHGYENVITAAIKDASSTKFGKRLALSILRKGHKDVTNQQQARNRLGPSSRR
jgi:hypothetical protein